MNEEAQKPSQIFRPKPRLFILYSLIPMFSLSASIAYAFTDPMNWVALSFYAFTLFSFGGLIELLMTHLMLYPDSIHFRHKFKKTIITKNEFEKITWEKGCDASILLKNGRWIPIPTPGVSAQGMCNTIRAWANQP